MAGNGLAREVATRARRDAGCAARGAVRICRQGPLKPDRDIDIGVLLEPGTEGTQALGVALDRAAGRPVDLVWLDAAPPLLRFEIARDGIVLAARDPHGWLNDASATLLDPLETFLADPKGRDLSLCGPAAKEGFIVGDPDD